MFFLKSIKANLTKFFVSELDFLQLILEIEDLESERLYLKVSFFHLTEWYQLGC